MFHIYCVFHAWTFSKKALNRLYYRVWTSYEVCTVTLNVENPTSMQKKSIVKSQCLTRTSDNSKCFLWSHRLWVNEFLLYMTELLTEHIYDWTRIWLNYVWLNYLPLTVCRDLLVPLYLAKGDVHKFCISSLDWGDTVREDNRELEIRVRGNTGCRLQRGGADLTDQTQVNHRQLRTASIWGPFSRVSLILFFFFAWKVVRIYKFLSFMWNLLIYEWHLILNECLLKSRASKLVCTHFNVLLRRHF